MLRKILAYRDVVLILLAFNQCDQCKTNFVEDITQWELVWDEAVSLSSFPSSIDVEKGISCHVPSEDAVYFLEPTGACCKFTQAPTGGLTCEPIANFSGITNQEQFFAFPAGSVQEQTLHVGIVNQQNITLTRYEGGIWEKVWSDSLEVLENKAQAEGSACFVTNYEEDQLHGLIVLKPKAVRQQPVVLCYDAKQKELKPSSTWKYQDNQAPDTAIEIAPGVIINAGAAVFYWTEKNSKYERVQGQPLSPLDRHSLFLLHAQKLISQAFLVCFVKEDGKTKLQFYTVPHANPYEMRRSSDLPEELKKDDEQGVDNSIDHEKSLVLPFSEVVYVVAEDKDGGLIYYKGSLKQSTT